jgi:uncharacterized protein (TIGR03083 family)
VTANRPCPVDRDRSVAALRLECRAVATLLAHLRGDVLGRPTRLTGWSLQLLVAHLVRGVTRIPTYLDLDPPAVAEVDWLGYWRAARVSDPGDVSERARAFAAEVNDRRVPDVWEEAWQAAHTRASTTPPDRVVASPFGGIRLDHYLTTRVVEVTVHGLDLRAAVDLEEVATPLGLDVTTAVLDGLLDGPRPPDVADDPVAYVLAATGRRPHDAPAFPLLS